MRGRALQPDSHRRAFTLIEVTVVILLLAVVAGFVVPRLARSERREAEATARGLAALFSAAAQRDAGGGERIAIEHDDEEGVIRMLVLRARGMDRDDEPVWIEDPFIAPVEFNAAQLEWCRAGTVIYRDEPFLLDFVPELPRPDLAASVRTRSGDAAWTIELPAWRNTAVFMRGGVGGALGPVDLDGLGWSEVTW